MINFPAHKGALHLTHNDHLNNYCTVAEAIDEDDIGYDEWVSEEQKQKARDTNDCWYLQWYPETSVGFCTLAAADLDVLLAAVKDL